MSTNTMNSVALAEFETASNAADQLAARIATSSGAARKSSQMLALLKAWQTARREAREAHERLLARGRTNLRA